MNSSSVSNDPIEFDDFLRVDIRAGTILSAKHNPKAKKPAYEIDVDFGDELGTKKSSAQLRKVRISPVRALRVLAASRCAAQFEVNGLSP